MLPLTNVLPAAIAAMLVGLVMAVRRMKVGFVLLAVACLGALAYRIASVGFNYGAVDTIMLVLIVVFAALGLGYEEISDRLHLRVGWVGQNTVWGGLIGGMIGLFIAGGALWMLLGTFVGTVAAQFSGHRGRGSVGRALRDGCEGFFAMFGGAGLRVILAVVMIDLSLALLG